MCLASGKVAFALFQTHLTTAKLFSCTFTILTGRCVLIQKNLKYDLCSATILLLLQKASSTVEFSWCSPHHLLWYLSCLGFEQCKYNVESRTPVVLLGHQMLNASRLHE